MNYFAITVFALCFILYGFVIFKKINYIRVLDQTLMLIAVIAVGNYFYFKKMPFIWQFVFVVTLVIMRFLWVRFYGDRGGIYIYNASTVKKGIDKLIKKHSKEIVLTKKYKNQINYELKDNNKEALNRFLKELNEYIALNGKVSFSEYVVVLLFIILFITMML